MPERQRHAIIDGHPVEETWYSNTVRVALYGADFNTIQAAINYAVTQTPTAAGRWTVLVYPGTYGLFTMAQYVDVLGIDKESVIISGTNVTSVTMANDSRIANLTINMLATAGGSAYGIEINDAGCRIEDINIFIDRDVTGGLECVGIIEDTGNTARDIYIRNARIECEQVVNTNTHGISIRQANKTVYLEESYVQGSDYGLAIGISAGAAIASTIHSIQNFFQTTAALGRAVYCNGGSIYLHEDSIARGCSFYHENAGLILYTDGNEIYHVFEGMSIQDALTAGAGEEVQIHDGDHYPDNPAAPGPALTVAAGTYVHGSGQSCVIHGTAAHANINNLVLINGNNVTLKDMKLILDAGCGTAGARPNVTYATGRTLVWLESLWLVGDQTVADDGSDLRQCSIAFDTVTESKILSCRSENNKRHGIYFASSTDNTLTSNSCLANTADGIYLHGSSRCTITGNISRSNTRYGIWIYNASNDNTLTGNLCQSNVTGIFIDVSYRNIATGNTCYGNAGTNGIEVFAAEYTTLTGNTCCNNYRGIEVDATFRIVVTGNQCSANTTEGIKIEESSHCTVTGNVCYNNATGIYVGTPGATHADYNAVSSNACYSNTTGINIVGANANHNLIAVNQVAGNTTNLSDTGNLTHVEESNIGITPPQVKRYVYMKNTSGAQRAIGDVVRHKAVAAGDEFEVPTAIGEEKVLGKVAEVINDNAYGYVLVAGKTVQLKATNVGGGNIAIGDLLCTEVGVRARKAAAGMTFFAIALEACAAADCTLDALLINPMAF